MKRPKLLQLGSLQAAFHVPNWQECSGVNSELVKNERKEKDPPSGRR